MTIVYTMGCYRRQGTCRRQGTWAPGGGGLSLTRRIWRSQRRSRYPPPMMAIEWTCEGCGYRVIAFGITSRPAHQFCAVCAWLTEHIADPPVIEAIRRARPEWEPPQRPPWQGLADG